MYRHFSSGRNGVSRFTILIALLWHVSAVFSQEPYDLAIDKGAQGSYPVREFYSSDIKVPKVNFVKQSPECADEDAFYFITPKGWKVETPGPMILDHRGELVWAAHFDNEFGGQTYDLMVQEYLGEKFLTFWLGDDRIRGHGAGHFHMINPAYDTIHQIGAANGRSADLHEFLLTPEGTALILVFEPISFDVRPAGRDFDDVWNQAMWDCLIQEVNITNGDAIFEWRASEHLNIEDSYHKIADRSDGTPEHPYDPFHFNSVDKDELGNYLVSARYTHAIHYISGTTKEVIWTLGGKNNTFMDLSSGEALNFAWQHDARFVGLDAFPETYQPPPPKDGSTTKLLTIFDNAAEDWNYKFGPANARGLLLEITYPNTPSAYSKASKPVHDNKDKVKADFTTLSKLDAEKVLGINGTEPAYTVKLVQQYSNPASSRASSQGSMQIVPSKENGKDPHVLLGHGINAAVAEYKSDGTLLCDMHFAAQSSWEKGDVQSYRALKFRDWVGRPHVPPDMVIEGNYAYVSWNGATGVHEWLLQTWEGDDWDHWKAASVVKKQGFETKIEIPKDRLNSKYMRVTAIDENSHPCEHGVSDMHEKGYLYGRRKQTNGRSWGQTLLFTVGSFAAALLMVRLLRRCYATFQRRRFAKWRLP